MVEQLERRGGKAESATSAENMGVKRGIIALIAAVATEVSKVRLIDADALIGALHHYAFLEGDDRSNKSICYNIIRRQPTIEPETQWIPCSNMLPHAEEKEYWICTNSGYQCQCRWTNVNHIWTDLTTDWHWHIMDIPQHTKVVAWMPLPEPYKEEKCLSK